jgi:DNA-binding SARP family transcriptional activator
MEFRLLGPLEVLEDGRVLAVAGGKATAVLALLALNANRVVSRGALLDAVWPNEGESARRSLEVNVSRLRKMLTTGDTPGGGHIISRGGGYQLTADPDAIDAVRFDHHVASGQRALDEHRHDAAVADFHAALALWRGRPLEGLEAYAFAIAEADRLEDVRLGVLEARFEADLALGRHQAIIGDLRKLATAHPEREALRHHLMLALYRNGRQADALAAYTQARRYLVEQLGIEPSDRLRDLERAILRHDRALELPVPASPDTAHPPVSERTGNREGSPPASAADVRTFLIADVRGYTRFTLEHGDEAASALAMCFAEVARITVPEFDGTLLELRGDEALCVFGSARQALRAAVDLQRRLCTASGADGAFPLGVGIGLDAGEAVPTDGGFRGGALNLASRLCEIAAPGQIVATETVANLAGRVDGLRFGQFRRITVKGRPEPVRVVDVLAELPLPPAPTPPSHRRGSRRRRTAVLAILAGVLVLAAVAVAGHRLVAGNDGAAHHHPGGGAQRTPTPTLVVHSIGSGGTFEFGGVASTPRIYRRTVDIRFYSGSQTLKQVLTTKLATVSRNGRYELVFQPRLAPGTYTSQTSQSWGGGAGHLQSPPVQFTVPTRPAGAPDDHGDLAVTFPSAGGTVSETRFRITGTDDPNPAALTGYVQVIVYPGQDMRTRRVWTSDPVPRRPDGTWAVNFDAELPQGQYTIFAKQTNSSGFPTGLSRAVTFAWARVG